MQEKEIKSWSEFADILSEIKTEIAASKKIEGAVPSKILYRGQSNAMWQLDSTLERYSKEMARTWSIKEYIILLSRCAPQIESFTDQKWDFPNIEWVEGQPLPCLEFWVHVRHCGFPSPLLDWTESPYVAAFFAFQEKCSDAEKAAIFIYTEHPRGSKGGWEADPAISVINANVKTHKRHYLQQSRYTICRQPSPKGLIFVPHQKVFDGSYSQRGWQDVLYKINILRSERFNVLSSLSEMNINCFSLFQSEESLMASLASKYIDMIP